ncbi:MAG TPA: sugar transferase [Candidatus Paceibacterota bacterium]|nr:sugar transferase [Candidatus Paceibacterota bacterium]
MFIHGQKSPLILLLGDVLVFVFALWLTLSLRYLGIPSQALFLEHAIPFAILFAPWVIVYVIVGLYDRQASMTKGILFRTLFRAQVVNILIAVTFFYFNGAAGITPKTILLLYLIISSALIFLWRMKFVPFVLGANRERALLIGRGKEIFELEHAVNGGANYRFRFAEVIDLDAQELVAENIFRIVREREISIVVLNVNDEIIRKSLPELYHLLFVHVYFVNIQAVYESVFSKMALDLLDYEWFLENISAYQKRSYDGIKRLMDILIAAPLMLVSCIIFPFVYIAIKLDDGGPMFIFQERIGKDNKIIRIPKMRSMKTSDRGVWVKEQDDRITRVGRFLRKSRIDELPQLFSVLTGSLSLVGPRPDICDLGAKLAEEIPYYALRSIIKPGLSGWAQVRQENAPQSLEETRERLAYDFYYLKHRSFSLDIKIALQTIATLASRAGR